MTHIELYASRRRRRLMVSSAYSTLLNGYILPHKEFDSPAQVATALNSPGGPSGAVP